MFVLGSVSAAKYEILLCEKLFLSLKKMAIRIILSHNHNIIYTTKVVVDLDENRYAFRCQVLGRRRRQTDPAGHQGGGRKRKRSAFAPVRPQDHRADVTGRPDRIRHRPFRHLVRSVHRGLWPRDHSDVSQRPAVVENARRTPTGRYTVFI